MTSRPTSNGSRQSFDGELSKTRWKTAGLFLNLLGAPVAGYIIARFGYRK